MNITSAIAADGWSLITTCEGLRVCAEEDLPRDEARTPCFTGTGSGSAALFRNNGPFFEAVEAELQKRVEELEKGNRPTLATDRHGNLRVKVVLRDQLESTREQAVERVEKVLQRLSEKQAPKSPGSPQ